MSGGQDNLVRTKTSGDVDRYDPDFDVEGTAVPPIQIDHPDYYNQGKIEVIDFIEDQGHLGFCRQTAIKYICRSGKKSGSTKEHDLRKAIYYLEREMGFHRKDGK
jgi:hypothetical protein